MFLGTSSKFSDLAHSARQSTVIDPNTDGQTTQLQSTCILSHIWPSAGVGGYSRCLTPLHHVRITQGPLWPLAHPSPPWSLG